MTRLDPLVLLRGGGDLATGVAARLWRSGFKVVVTEIEQPLAVRRLVALSEAIYEGEVAVEDLRAKRVERVEAAAEMIEGGVIPVLIDPSAESRRLLVPAALVDARMTKAAPDLKVDAATFVVGLGPGFEAGVHAHAVVETHRGHRMGRVLWEGGAQPDTGVPDPVAGHDVDRVLRSPADGTFDPVVAIGSRISQGERIASVNGAPLEALFDGVLRGLLHGGLQVSRDAKVGDLDPRGDATLSTLISDKALAVGGGVLEALLSQSEIRNQLAGTRPFAG